MNYALAFSIFICGMIAGVGLLGIASVVGEWLHRRSRAYPPWEELPRKKQQVITRWPPQEPMP